MTALILDTSALLGFPDAELIGAAIGSARARGNRIVLPVVALALARSEHRVPEVLDNVLVADAAVEVVDLPGTAYRQYAATLAFVKGDPGAGHAALLALLRDAPVLTRRPELYGDLNIDLRTP